MSTEPQRFGVRRANVTACSRCRSRKQRCDRRLPACSSCERAGVECLSADLDGRVAPRSYIKSLEDHIAYLENKLTSYGILDVETPPVGISPSGRNNVLPIPPASHLLETETQDAIEQIAFESLEGESFTRSIVNRNGLSMISSLLADPLARARRNQARRMNHEVLLDQLPQDKFTSLPPRNVAQRLVETYFQHSDFFSPIILSKDRFFSEVASLYDNDTPDQQDHATRFRAFIVFGTAFLLLNRSDSSVPPSRSEPYFAGAIALLSEKPDVLCTGDLDHLTILLLIIQYLCFCSNLTAAWHFVGLATRLAVELNMHNEQAIASRLGPEDLNTRRWLFWTTYIFERNLCVIIGRPFSVPDGAISTPLPDPSRSDPDHIFALHQINSRRLESEMYTTLNYTDPSNGVSLDGRAWREGMHRRWLAWRAAVPPMEETSKLAPADIFDNFLSNAIVLLYYPSPLIPSVETEHLRTLAEHATRSIDSYNQTFRQGKLRFYWRTVHNLFRCGVAVAYCIHTSAMNHEPIPGVHGLDGALHSCSSILWGMVERYPPGKAYRDVFENLAGTVVNRKPTGHAGLGYAEPSGSAGHAQHASIMDQLSAELEGTDLPFPAVDTLLWGFRDTSGDSLQGG